MGISNQERSVATLYLVSWMQDAGRESADFRGCSYCTSSGGDKATTEIAYEGLASMVDRISGLGVSYRFRRSNEEAYTVEHQCG